MPSSAALSTAFAAAPRPPLSSVLTPLWSAVYARIGLGTRAFLLLGGAVLIASVLGLASRHAFSVSFWPANAVLVGLALRDRRLFRVTGWIGAVAGFIAADLLFGRPLSLAAFFALANAVGTMTATALLIHLDPRDLALRRVHSVMRILLCLLPACLTAGLCGAALVVVMFQGSASQALLTWPASELVNYLVVLPAILTVRLPWRERRLGKAAAPLSSFDPRPTLALAASFLGMIGFDGPGSIVFPLPALLLCALTYSIATTAILTMILGTGCLTMIGLGMMNIGQDMSIPHIVLSVRVAVAFLVLAPLTVSSAMAVREDLLNQLREAADHDGLTGLLNRRAFEQRMRHRIDGMDGWNEGLVVLWLDIDHFKAINDNYGHPAGDAVLQAFARTARTCCREGDLIGRLGGEEFALLAQVSSRDAADALAERLLDAFAAQVVSWDGVSIKATVSIGACHLTRKLDSMPDLARQLDEALYRAKRKGRARIEWLSAAQVMPERPAPRLVAVG